MAPVSSGHRIERHDPAVELNGRIRMRDHEEVTLVL
jgi:hypothetical protein